MPLNETTIMALARAIFWPAAHVYVPFPSFDDHPWPDEVVHGRQLDMVLVTGHRQSIVRHRPILVMVVGHVVRDKLSSVSHLPRYHYLVPVNVLLQGIYPWNGYDFGKFGFVEKRSWQITLDRDVARRSSIKASNFSHWLIRGTEIGIARNVPRFRTRLESYNGKNILSGAQEISRLQREIRAEDLHGVWGHSTGISHSFEILFRMVTSSKFIEDVCFVSCVYYSCPRKYSNTRRNILPCVSR